MVKLLMLCLMTLKNSHRFRCGTYKMHRELLKSQKHNEKHRFDAISKFQKMLFFDIIFRKFQKIQGNDKKMKIQKKNVKGIERQSTSPPSENLVDG